MATSCMVCFKLFCFVESDIHIFCVKSSVCMELSHCCLRALFWNVYVSIVRCNVSTDSVCCYAYAAHWPCRSLPLLIFPVDRTSL